MGPRKNGTLTPSPTRALGRLLPHLASRALSGALLCAIAPSSLAQQALLRADLPEAPQPQIPSQTPSQTPSQPAPQTSQQQPTSIRGTVLDRDGAALPNALITLTQPGEPSPTALQTTSAADGTFTLSGLNPGPFTLSVVANGFTREQTTGSATASQTAQLSPITLHPGTASDIEVTLTRTEIAEDQIHDEEQQRVLGVLPNYYVSYLPNALPLSRRQKLELASKAVVNPFTFVITGAAAGIQQANNTNAGYGQGAAGYGKRYASNYGGVLIDTGIGGALLPILFRQDPRYFYQGTGTIRSRIFRSTMQVVVAKGDNGHWQPNYSGILGNFATAGIENAYLPAENRNDGATVVNNTLIGFAGGAVGNIFQEFVVRHFTPHARKSPPPPSADPHPTPATP